jgi:hypothetical protein
MSINPRWACRILPDRAAWAALAVRTLVRRRKLHPADEAPALRTPGLDWFLLFFPPLWLAATLRQGWPLTAKMFATPCVHSDRVADFPRA